MQIRAGNPLAPTFPLTRVPQVARAELTSKSYVREACYAYIKSPAVQSRIRAGAPRAHEPYLQLAKHFGDLTIEQFASSDYASDWRDENYDKLAGGTINGIRSKCNRLCGWLKEKKLVNENGWREIERAPASPKKRQTRKLSKGEIQTVLKELDKVKVKRMGYKPGAYGTMFRFALLTGMRYGEILLLQEDWIDFVNGTAKIVQFASKTRVEREVVLSEEAMKLLKTALAQAQDPVNNPQRRVFPFSYNAMRDSLDRLHEEGKVPKVFFHLTRHTAISQYAEVAESLGELQEFSGHRSASAVANYLHKGLNLKSVVRSKLHHMQVA